MATSSATIEPARSDNGLTLRRLAGPAVIAIAFVVMTAWSWQAWADILVDFGREAYVARQLAQGRVLYRDVAYLAGPLSPYLNSIWVRLFGTSLMTLALVNLAVLAAMVTCLHALLRRVSDGFSATIACLVMLGVFAFGQLLRIENYNFVCPYAHEMTHGIALSLLAIALLGRYQARVNAGLLLGSGLALGLVFLTKPEIFVAAAGALAAGVAGTMVMHAPGARATCGRVAIFLLGALLGPMAAVSLLRSGMSWADAVRGMLGGWTVIFLTDATSLPFFRRSMGLDEPGTRIVEMVVWLLGHAIVFGAAAGLSFLVRRRRMWWEPLGLGLGLTLGAGLILAQADLTEGVRPLPLIMLVVAGAAAVLFARAVRSGRRADATRHLLRLVLSVFAGLLLLKIVLYVRVFHYGFALTMPAALLAAVALVSWVPRLIERRGGAGIVFQAAGLAVVLATVVVNLRSVGRTIAHKTAVAGGGPNAIRTLPDDRAEWVVPFIRDLDQFVPPAGTLACLPEGAMLNVQTDRVNPTPFVDFNPLEVLVFGEDRMIAAFAASPPDYVALVHKDTSEFGATSFGRDYAQRLFAWIVAHYEPRAQLGARPLVSDEFGILLLERRAGGENTKATGPRRLDTSPAVP